jgi:predicted enzyme related to lactoylglutathione lyase
MGQNMAKALGIGGVFFKSADPKKLTAWYVEHLGFVPEAYGGARFLPDAVPQGGCTVWNPFNAGTDYFAPSTKDFMLNLIVDDVAAALQQVAAGGAQIVGEIADYDYGRFGHFIDPDGNKIELWEPKG